MLKALENSDAAVIFILGQSNAHAHEQFLREEEKITTPLKNVFSLDRNPNQTLHPDGVVWSGYTTAGKNLAETQDHTCCFAYNFAKMWQGAIDGGARLPDLYIVQISIGSQGIKNGMWNKNKSECLVPGRLGTVDISLYPMCIRMSHAVMRDLRSRFKNIAVLGIQWLGSEQDAHPGGYTSEDFRDLYDDFFRKIPAAIGENTPVCIYRLSCYKFSDSKEWADGIAAVNAELDRQAGLHGFEVTSAENSPFWDESSQTLGVFAPDNAHYLAKVQRWFAEQYFEEITKE